MKKFKTVTIICLGAIAILVSANIGFLNDLYRTYKGRYLSTVENCARQAYILSWVKALHKTYDTDNGKLTISFTIAGDSTESEWYDYPQLDTQLIEELATSMYAQSLVEPGMKDANFADLDSLFHRQLGFAGLHPEYAVIVPVDSAIHDKAGYWSIPFYIYNGKEHLYDIYISSLGTEVLKQMAGIIATSAGILALMSFLVWYLLHWLKKLRSIEQMKDDFTHNMTHELKTPVAVAYSAADSMLRYYDESDAERNKKLLGIILQRLAYLGGMIENILSMSMERFKTMKMTVEEINLHLLLTDISNMLELRADKQVKIRIDVPDDATVSADSLHFGNMISNILDNAMKYSGENVEISIKGDSYKITITDNGIGIAKDKLPRIFEKFYRVTHGDKYEVGGYGLGLFYVKQIVELMGWHINVDSTVGVGTSITIKFKKDEKR